MKILSLNTWLLPPPLAKDNRKRLREIVRIIEKEKPDVICLQEVWLNTYVRQLKNRLPDYTFQSSDTLLFNRSGLLFGSKKSVQAMRSDIFPDSQEHSLEEKLAGKGWQLASFENLSVLHTHLYAPTESSGYGMTKAQLQQLEALDLPDETILVGDCNLPRDEFCQSTTRFVCPDDTEHTITSDNTYTSTRFNNSSDAKWSYITPTKQAHLSVTTFVRKQPVVSDHYTLIGNVVRN
jgi:endonuclease/exonuclease/phosphatase family metal-dependent hydrolase